MTFRELLKLYQQNKLDDAQRSLVESEIEKHEAISDYLYENTDIPELCEIEKENDCSQGKDQEDEAQRFAQMVNKTIRRAFVKMGTVVGSVILLVVLAVVFILPDAVSLFYYNPDKTAAVSPEGIPTNQMSLDLAVLSELYLPGNYRDSAVIQKRGYGAYDITIHQSISSDGRFTSVAGRLERNKLNLYDPNLLHTPAGNSMLVPGDVYWFYHGIGAAGSPEEAFAQLQNLDEEKVYTAYFSLDSLMDYESFYNKMQIGEGVWCAVYTGPNTQHLMGFYPAVAGRGLSWDKENYPLLRTWDGESSWDEVEAAGASGEKMQTHFVSMLRYMKDFPKITQLANIEGTNWNGAIRYVQENGLQIYGFAVTAKKEEILQLAQQDGIAYVYTVPAA